MVNPINPNMKNETNDITIIDHVVEPTPSPKPIELTHCLQNPDLDTNLDEETLEFAPGYYGGHIEHVVRIERIAQVSMFGKPFDLIVTHKKDNQSYTFLGHWNDGDA